MLIVTGIISVLPSDIPGFVADLHVLADASRQRDGNLSYEAGILDTLAGRILVAERWRDQAALTRHLQADDTIAFVRKWQDRMQGDVRKFDAANERSLNEI